jgi:integrase
MASVTPRSGSFRVEWRLGGRGGRKQSVTLPELYMANAAKALAEAHTHRITDDEVYKAVLGIDGQETDVALTPTLAEWIIEWGDRKVDVAASTLKEYMRLLRSRVVPRLGDRRLAEITEDDIAAFVAWMAKDLMPAGVRKVHVVLHQVLQTAVPRHIPVNPAAKPAGQRKGKLPKIKRYRACFLTPEEADMIIRAAAPQIVDLIRTALGTGLRLGELLGLRVQDVDLDAKTPLIRVEQSLKRDGTFGAPKSEKSERSVTISRSLVEILRRRTEGKRPIDLIFPAPEGGPWNANNLRNRYWCMAVAAAGRCAEHPPPMIRCGRGGRNEKIDPLSVSTCACKTRLHQKPRIHDARHTHVGWLIDAGWDLYAIQQRIGHESIKTTFDVYGHRLSHGDTDRLDALDQMLDQRRRKSGMTKRERRPPTADLGDGLQQAA